MPNKRQAAKRARRDERRREINALHVSRMKTAIRNFKKLIQAKDLEIAKAKLPFVVSMIQHAAAKGSIHKNEAARRVSRVTQLLNKALASNEQK